MSFAGSLVLGGPDDDRDGGAILSDAPTP